MEQPQCESAAQRWSAQAASVSSKRVLSSDFPDLAVSLCPARADEASSHTLSQVLDGVGRRRKPLPLGGVLGDSLGT